MRAREPRPAAPGRRRWWLVGLGAFLVLDVLLVWLAVDAAGRTSDSERTALPITAFAPPPPAAPASPPAGATPTPTPTPGPPLVLEPTARQLQPLDAERAWRTSMTACGSGGVIEWTEDAGASWVPWSAGGDVVGILGLVSYAGADIVGVVAMVGGACETEYRMSYTAGEFWGAFPDQEPAFALVDPSGTAVRTTSGTVPSPCGTVSEIAEVPGGLGVLCTSADLVVGDPGLGAVAPVALAGRAVAIAPSGDALLAASRRDPGCADGIQLQRVGLDGAVAPGVCLPGHPDEAQPVTLGVAPDGAVWLWAGDRVGVSADGGASWRGLG